MSVAPMSRSTKRAYLRLCPEKKNLVHKGLSGSSVVVKCNGSNPAPQYNC